MSTPGGPEGESLSGQREGSRVSALAERRAAVAHALRLLAARPAPTALVVLLAAAVVCALALASAFARAGALAAEASGAGPEVSVFVRPGTAPAELDALRARLAAVEGVRTVRVVPRDQAFAELGKRAGLNLEGRANPLPDVLIARFALLGDPARVGALAAAARSWPGVDAVRADNDGYTRLARTASPLAEAGRAASAVALICAGIALLLGLVVLVRPDHGEATVLLLGGATRRAVVRPYAYVAAVALGLGSAVGLASAAAAWEWLAARWSAALQPWGAVAVPADAFSLGAGALAVAAAAVAGGVAGAIVSRLHLGEPLCE
jgi:cell division protein FtsX